MIHIPVLLNPILDAAKAMDPQPKTYLDATFGRGGHLRSMLEAFPEMKAMGLDQDIEAIRYGEEHFKSLIDQQRLQLLHGNFHDIEGALKDRLMSFTLGQGYDCILVDLGVSSPQLDVAERGFSFYHDGPLDMRMDQSRSGTAADILNTWDEASLIQLFREYGEIRQPTKVVKMVIQQRKERAFLNTLDFAGLVERAEGWRTRGHHPATRYFLALRMEVNQELENLEKSIDQLVELLNQNGRLMILTFHSLEDRIVKYALKAKLHLGSLVNKKVIQPSREEEKSNPRARSAKLRIFQKGEPHE